MRFQERDSEIIHAIDKYGGMLAARHLKMMFWPDKSLRAMQKRLSALVGNNYLCRPTKREWNTKPIPEAIYWLGSQGVLWLASQYEVSIDGHYISNLNENQQRKLEKELRDGGISWLRIPRWNQLVHDLAIVDCRVAVEQAISALPGLTLEEWKNESHFRSEPDVIEYEVLNRDGTRTREKKGICPDSYFVIVSSHRVNQGRPARARFLLELDGATHSNPKFGRDKVIPGVVYLQSKEYKARFGANAGRWLVVTTGEKRRLRNLIEQTQASAEASAKVFFFTTFSKMETQNFFLDPIWWQPGSQQPVSLLPSS